LNQDELKHSQAFEKVPYTVTSYVSKNVTKRRNMKNKQAGFSLVEILIVLVIIGILASIAFPFLRRARMAAENANAYATMKTIINAEYTFYSHNQRFGTFVELNSMQTLGTLDDEGRLIRGAFTFSMVPPNPSEQELRDGFTITASRGDIDIIPYTITGDHTGQIIQVTP
jgi:prepilin-type N-terminal cleavage/methylation domain-containing protein